MKVKIDYDLCEANAVCMTIAPDIFEVNDEDELNLLVEEPPESSRPLVLKAIARCPRGAISVEE